ncbi:MAG: hydantoinase/oxoprolinase family protein [Deltaproteobacteria bacterium]|nr:hydantoinase/oxoprolinase family protein [Deltaproteobacteria bacterium]
MAMHKPARRRNSAQIIVGVDTGGTFTDLVAMVGSEIRVHKLLSTPHDPAQAVVAGIKALLEGKAPQSITYSSTVATNALLEKKGARVGLFVDAGFEDLIEIGRQNRSQLYALAPSRPEPLVARNMRFGVDGRTYFDGTLTSPLDETALTQIREIAQQSGAEAIAVCLLHSYVNPSSEEAIARAVEPLGLPLSVSHRILPEYREYERLSTTVINAYVAPRMVAHLGNLERQLESAHLRVMQSNGSVIGTSLASSEPVRTLLSGPAAGVVGAAKLAAAMGIERFITFDMGGTSTDVSLFEGRARIRTLSHPGGYPVRTPVIDIHTVGAGGGSLASIDAGGSLKVGPESAGADPGPACYGRAELPAVTDADLVAGRLLAENFLGGRMRLYPERAAGAIEKLAHTMKTDAANAARGVIRVVNANMERAIRVITIERGFDPRDFALLAFGGAGPMHAAELALELGIRHIVLPKNPGLLCAWGALGAPLGREYSLTIREVDPELRRLQSRARPMIARARAELLHDGASAAAIRNELWVDMRYRGQSYELEVELNPHFVDEFHEAHRRMFGHSAVRAAVEVVNLRLRAHAAGPAIAPPRLARRASPPTLNRTRVLTGSSYRAVPVYERDAIGADVHLSGPMIVVELSSTAYVSPEFSLRCDDYGNLHLEAR